MNGELPARSGPGLGWLIAKAAACMNLRLSRSFAEAGLPISPEQYGVLASAAGSPQSSQAELARFLGRDGPSLTRLADSLEGKGLLSRVAMEGDRRAYRLAVTAKGSEILAAAGLIIAREEQTVARAIASDASGVVAEAMKTLIDFYTRLN